MFYRFFTLLTAITIVSSAFAQLETRTLNWDELERTYLEYVPTNYSGDEAVPVVFGLHGLGDDMNNFYNVGMNYIADTAGFILIVPQAETFQTMTAWNSGASLYGITPNTDVDDTGFLMAVLDSLENNFNIDTESIYFFGFSMGGYMCNRLAAEVPERINAIASISGTMGVNFTPEPSTTDFVACLHFHGTADGTVQYTGNGSGMDADELVEFWRNNNGNDETPIVYNYPDTESDGLTFERYVYPNGENQVVHIKVIGGDHQWYYSPVNDVDYGTEIWTFFRNRFSEVPTNIPPTGDINISIYPNPASEYLKIDLNEQTETQIYLFNALGVQILCKTISNDFQLKIDNLPEGLYYLNIIQGNNQQTFPVSKQ